MKLSGQVSPYSLKLSQISSNVYANDSARIFDDMIFKSHEHLFVNSSKTKSILLLRVKKSKLCFSVCNSHEIILIYKKFDIIRFYIKSTVDIQHKVGGLSNQF